MDQAPLLELKVLSSGKLKGQVLRINAQGLEGSLRNARDGTVYLGCKKSSGKSKGEEALNDFIIPSKDKETEQRHRGRHV